MSDRDLSDSLLNQDARSQAAIAASREEALVLEADRRRMRRLTAVVVVLWVLAAAGAFLVAVIGGFTFPKIAHTLQEEGGGRIDDANTPFLMLAKLTAVGIVVGSASFCVLVAAGLSTVLLMIRSRQATLRQIHASLLQISRQLQILRTTPPGTPGSTPPPATEPPKPPTSK